MINKLETSLFTEMSSEANLSDLAVGSCVGVILNPDGGFQMFSKNIDVSDAQHSAIAEKISAVAVALASQQIMAVLLDLAANTPILDLMRSSGVAEAK